MFETRIYGEVLSEGCSNTTVICGGQTTYSFTFNISIGEEEDTLRPSIIKTR